MSNERCKSTVFVVVSASTPPAWRRRRRFARFTATRTAACSARKALATAMNGAVRGCRLRCFDVWRWMGKHNTICSMTQVGSDVLNMCFGFFCQKKAFVESCWRNMAFSPLQMVINQDHLVTKNRGLTQHGMVRRSFREPTSASFPARCTHPHLSRVSLVASLCLSWLFFQNGTSTQHGESICGYIHQ